MTKRQFEAAARHIELQALKRDAHDVKNAMTRLESKVRRLSAKEANRLFRIMCRFESWQNS
jgi:hypothetical protein